MLNLKSCRLWLYLLTTSVIHWKQFFCANRLHFKIKLKLLKLTNTWINTIFKILSKNSCFWVKNMGQESFRPTLKVELLLTVGPQNILSQRSGLARVCGPFLSWRHCGGAVQSPARGGYSCSSNFQHPQPSNCHCWDRESSQIAMVTYPLMLRGSATAKHWPTDTW